MEHIIEPVAHIRSCFPDKFGIPRQSGLAPSLKAEIILEKKFRNPDILRGLSDFSHIWLIWGFSENADRGWTPTVRPPRLGGNTRIGVFATRSPFRPNGLGLSSVRLEEIRTDSAEGPVLIVSGADLMDGTPIYDIKPYITLDCRENAVCGFQNATKDYALQVEIPSALLSLIPEELRQGLFEILSQDPRPSYQNDPDRIYGISFANFDVHFRVADGILIVTEIVV